MGKKHLKKETKDLIIAWNHVGVSNREIARRLQRDEANIRRFLSRCRRNGNGHLEETRGRPRKTNERTDRHIKNLVEQDRFVTASEVQSYLSLGNISKETIRRRIRDYGGFESFTAVKKPLIREKNRVARLQWCLDRQDWSVDEWRKVLWSDESPFVLRYNGRRHVWRRPGERYDKRCTVATVKHDVKIMVWGCFAAHSVGPLHLIDGIMDKNVYLSILEDQVHPTIDTLFGGENYYFQQDNDPKHTSFVCRDFLADNFIKVLDWPAQSPDLNPIENLWSILNYKTKERKVNNREQLFDCLQKAWGELPNDILSALVESMPRRCAAVIEANGMATKY